MKKLTILGKLLFFLILNSGCYDDSPSFLYQIKRLSMDSTDQYNPGLLESKDTSYKKLDEVWILAKHTSPIFWGKEVPIGKIDTLSPGVYRGLDLIDDCWYKLYRMKVTGKVKIN